MKKSKEQWIANAKQRNRYYFFYQDKVLDLTELVSLPSQINNTLANYLYSDITLIFSNLFPNQTKSFLKKLIQNAIGIVCQNKGKKIKQKSKSRTKTDLTPKKQKKKVYFKKVCTVEDTGSRKEATLQKLNLKKSILSNKTRHYTQPKRTVSQFNKAQNFKLSQISLGNHLQRSYNSTEYEPTIQNFICKQPIQSKKQQRWFNQTFKEQLQQNKGEVKIPIFNARQMLSIIG